jgi:sRNA-binding regulator protein Hfq
MLQSNQPIYPRVKTAQPPQKPTPPVKLSPEDIDRKQLQHDDQWLHDRRGKSVIVVFLDGEQITGKVLHIRKFHFSLDTEKESLMVYKVGVKYVREAKD